MQREPLLSNSLTSVGYDADTQTLEIEFKTGEIYRYLNVPESVYITFINSDSPGRFFIKHIKDAGYEFQKVEKMGLI